jgi:hypothetical protein
MVKDCIDNDESKEVAGHALRALQLWPHDVNQNWKLKNGSSCGCIELQLYWRHVLEKLLAKDVLNTVDNVVEHGSQKADHVKGQLSGTAQG